MVNEYVKYKKLSNVMHPPFASFTKFCVGSCNIDSCFDIKFYQPVQDTKPARTTKTVTVKKTEVPPESQSDCFEQCTI